MLKFFRLPFATTGDKTAVPDAVDVNGNVSYSQGYPFDYQRQKTDPAAKNIERDKMNQILFDVTTAIAEIQAQGIADFITTALNGGTAYSYSQFAVVRYSGELYLSLVAANTALPSDATKWALLPTPARLQSALNTRTTAAGTADAITGAFTPAIAALPTAPDTLSVMVRAGAANATTTPTFKADGTTAKTIVKGSNQALVAGDIPGAGFWMHLDYDATLDKWILQNPAYSVATPSPVQIQSVSASVAANALTVGYAGGVLNFRNATLTNGAPIAALTVGALSLVVPSSATLGTIAAQSARLALLVAYNAGAPVLCIANLAGGVNLDETTLISPTTISAGSTSASVIYSASAVGASSPFRVVGFVDIQEATPGTWATGPTTVQGAGGEAFTALQSFGYSQSIQDVTGSRAFGTTYYNTTGRPLAVYVYGTSTSTTMGLTSFINGAQVSSQGYSINGAAVSSFMVVPPGMSYSFTSTNITLTKWVEMR